MANIYAIANHKGGVGKTTTAISLAAVFSEIGKRTLLVDLDPQGGLSRSLGMEPESFRATTYQVMIGQLNIREAIVTTKLPGVDLIPANLDLAAVESELIGEIGWDRTMKDALEAVIPRYEKILLDCPPSLGVLTTNALIAAKTVIVPLQCEYLAMQGFSQLNKRLEKVRQKGNSGLQLRILRTMYDARTVHAREVSDEILATFGDRVMKPIIKRTVRFAEATVAGLPIVVYQKDSDVADAYRQLGEEICKDETAIN
jgi:chromosome partitioning protein